MLGLSRAHTGVGAHWSHAFHQMLAEVGTKHPLIPSYRLRRCHGNKAEKISSPRHSTHALTSIVKRLKSSTSEFFSTEITERALMWNLPPFISSIFRFFYSPCFASWRHPLHGHGSKCEALIKPWLLCFKGLAPSKNFPCATSLNLAPSDFHSSFHNHRNINEQSQLSWNAAWEFRHSFSTWHGNSPALTTQKDDCLGSELSGKLCGRLWKGTRWLSLQGILTSHSQHASLVTGFSGLSNQQIKPSGPMKF